MAEHYRRVSNGRGNSKFIHCDCFNDEEHSITRSGIIPFYIDGNEIYFILGVDSVWGTLSDFAGQKQKREDVFGCAKRESREETLDILSNVEKSDLKTCFLAHDNLSLTFFYPISKYEADLLNRGFSQINSRRAEMKAIRHLSSVEFIHAIKHNQPKIYITLRELLFDHIENICPTIYEHYKK